MIMSALPPNAQRRSLVLVADDEEIIQVLMTSIIQRLGLTAVCVHDGAAAIAVVESYREMLVCAIMDIAMPVLNGIDAAQAIQATAPLLPIVLMSGAIPEAYADRIAQLRLAAVLPKPFPLAVLRDLLCRLANIAETPEKGEHYERHSRGIE